MAQLVLQAQIHTLPAPLGQPENKGQRGRKAQRVTLAPQVILGLQAHKEILARRVI